MGLKERVSVRVISVTVISVRVKDHTLPDMGEHAGLLGALHAQRTVHLLHRAWCASTGGTMPLLVVPVGGCTAAVCVFCTRTCGDSGFSKIIFLGQ